MTKVLINNSCVFEGSNLLRYMYFNKLPYQIVGTDYLNNGYAKTNIYYNKNYKFYLGNFDNDVVWSNKLLDLERPDVIITPGTCQEIKIFKTQNTYELNDYKGNKIKYKDCFGIRQHPRSFIPNIIKCILHSEPIVLLDKGLITRQWLHTDDLNNAILKLAESNLEDKFLNLTSNWEITDLELVNHICNIMGVGHNLISFAETPVVSSPPLTISPEFSQLGWKQTVGFKGLLEQTIQWYLNNQWSFKIKD
jgi:dTDP-D-glucose 4,6-dehydratase